MKKSIVCLSICLYVCPSVYESVCLWERFQACLGLKYQPYSQKQQVFFIVCLCMGNALLQGSVLRARTTV
jgi:hypothetical protein